MFFSARRIVLFGAIAGIVLVIVLLPLILDILTGKGITNVIISLSEIQVMNTRLANNSIPLTVTFNMHNPTDKALTTSKIEYNLKANGKSLGEGILSYEDIPLNGRPQLYSGQTINVQSKFQLENSTETANLIRTLINDVNGTNSIKWSVEGEALIDSAFTSLPKSFSSNLN